MRWIAQLLDKPRNTNRDLLFGETAELHRAVDEKISILLNAGRDGYREMLALHESIIPQTEKFLADSKQLKGLPDIDMRWRTNAIRSDLQMLNGTATPKVDMSFLNAKPFSAGLMYVLEGSRLGGKIVARQLSTGTETELPRLFLTHGSEHRLWNSFVAWLNDLEWSPNDQRMAVQGAKEVFTAYLKA